MKLLLKFYWSYLQRKYLADWRMTLQRVVCWWTDHQWVNDGSWAAKARKCSRCGQREKGKEA